MPAVARAKSAKTKIVNGRHVSARSKTSDPACSQAMSDWVSTRKSGSTPASVFAILGQCRAKARALKQASQHKAAGNEAKAQRLEAIAAGKKGPVTAKDRMALAKEKRATLNAKRAANPITAAMQGGGASAGGASAPVKAEGRGTPERMRNAAGLKMLIAVGERTRQGGGGYSTKRMTNKRTAERNKLFKDDPQALKAYRVGQKRVDRRRRDEQQQEQQQRVQDSAKRMTGAMNRGMNSRARRNAEAMNHPAVQAAIIPKDRLHELYPGRYPAPKPNLKDQVAAHRAKKIADAAQSRGKLPSDGANQDRAAALAVRAKQASQKARNASLRADKAGKTEVAAKKDAAYRTNFARSENLAIKSGFKQPKNSLDVTDSVRAVSSSPASPQPAQAKAAGRGTAERMVEAAKLRNMRSRVQPGERLTRGKDGKLAYVRKTMLPADVKPYDGSNWNASPAAPASPRPLGAFGQSMTPLSRGKAKASLDATVRHNGEFMSRKAMIDKAVKSGAAVQQSKTGRRLTSPSGAFLDEGATTKTGMNYAEMAASRFAKAQQLRADRAAKRASAQPAASPQPAQAKAAGRGTAERMARANAIRNSLRSGQSHAGGAGPTGDRAYRVGMARAERSRNMTPREASVNAPAPTSEPWVHTGSRKSPGTGAEIYGEAGPQRQIKAPTARFTAARMERAKALRAERAAKNPQAAPVAAKPTTKATKPKTPRSATPKPGAKVKPVKGEVALSLTVDGEKSRKSVPATIVGDFAVHAKDRSYGGKWRISDTRSGGMFHDATTKAKAIKAAAVLNKYGVSEQTSFVAGGTDARAAARVANVLRRDIGDRRMIPVPPRTPKAPAPVASPAPAPVAKPVSVAPAPKADPFKAAKEARQARKVNGVVERNWDGTPTGNVVPFKTKVEMAKVERNARRQERAEAKAPPKPAPKPAVPLSRANKAIQENRAFKRRSPDAYATELNAAKRDLRENRLAKVREASSSLKGEDRKAYADKVKQFRRSMQSTPTAQARIAEQRTRADARDRANFPLFGGQTPNERPYVATPPTPSLRAQADAFRAGKGTVMERAEAIRQKWNKKVAKIDKQESKIGKELDATIKAKIRAEIHNEPDSVKEFAARANKLSNQSMRNVTQKRRIGQLWSRVSAVAGRQARS